MTEEAMTEEAAPFLDVRAVSKSFGSIRALTHADLEVRAGEVMALVGENGAGKSTLVKILAGMYAPDDGEILIDGRRLEPRAGGGDGSGVAVVQQELSLVPTLSVAENVFLGDPSWGWRTSPRALAKAAAPFLAQVGLADLDPLTRVERLSVAERQLIEVARLVSRDARVLLFDEPTAALAEREIHRVAGVVRSLRSQGRSIIYVTHRLDEVFDLADRVTVFRDGQSHPPVRTSEITLAGLISMMLGGSLASLFPPAASAPGTVVLEVRDLLTGRLGTPVNLEVRRGEIVGLAGQLGSGASDVLAAVSGNVARLGGTVRVDGQNVRSDSVRAAIKRGIGFCSSDRKRDGLFLQRPVTENLTSTSLDAVTRAGWLRPSAEKAMGNSVARTFTIDRTRLGSLAGALSGGNQQKVAVGKWTASRPKVLLIDEPTRGVDVGARAEIYSHLRALADDGLAVVIASSDAQEVVGLSDTIATFFKGHQISVCGRDETNSARVASEITHPQQVNDD